MNHSAAGVILRPRFSASETSTCAPRSASSLSSSRSSSRLSRSRVGGAGSCQPASVRACASSCVTLKSSARSGASSIDGASTTASLGDRRRLDARALLAGVRGASLVRQTGPRYCPTQRIRKDSNLRPSVPIQLSYGYRRAATAREHPGPRNRRSSAPPSMGQDLREREPLAPLHATLVSP